ncbi:MAG: sulfatase, partial [Lachnospiraceae bacterium]|nr:sulfatase [Lachnospiraceae bacterium]
LHDCILNHQNEIVDPFRGFPWACRPWRKDKKPSYQVDGYTRQRCEEGTIRYDYATGCPVEQEIRVKGMK